MTPAPISVERLPEKWRCPPTKAGVEWIEANARRQCAYELEQALPALLQQLAELKRELSQSRDFNAELNLLLDTAKHERDVAERARGEAAGLLREVLMWRRTVPPIAETPRKDGGIFGRIAAFLAASGG